MSLYLQLVALLCAGFFVWKLWKATSSNAGDLRLIVAAGFLIRAFAAQALFWISWLRLPFARSLQLPDGLWFFGLDATTYLSLAERAARSGPSSILTLPTTIPSVAFVRVLAWFSWLFGSGASTAILLNVTIFLLTSWLLVRWSVERSGSPRFAAVPLLTVSFLPSWILWSLQPLKDAFFCLLIIVFAYAVDRMLRLRTAQSGRLSQGVFAAVSLLILLHFIAGVRWYYAAIALAGATLASAALLLDRRPLVIAGRLVLLVLFWGVATQVFLISAGAYVPASLQAVLRPWNRDAGPDAVTSVADSVESARRNLDGYQRSATAIRLGDRMEEEAPPSRGQTSAAPVRPPNAPASSAVASTRPDLTASQTAGSVPSSREDAKARAIPTTPKAEPAAKPALRSEPASAPKSTAAQPGSTPVAAGRGPEPLPVSAAPPAIARQAPGSSQAAPETSSVSAASPSPQTPARAVPRTFKNRLIAGAAALLLPRWVGMKLGLLHVEGGRGMMWFAELDTLLVDLIFLVVLICFVRSVRTGAWKDPVIGYLLIVSILIAGALAYTVPNFGTLMRHRAMVVASVALLGMLLRRETAPSVESTAALAQTERAPEAP